jgi:hypothetical protein
MDHPTNGLNIILVYKGIYMVLFVCEICDYQTPKKANLLRHKKSKLHVKKGSLETKNKVKKPPKIPNDPKASLAISSTPKYRCQICDKNFFQKSNLIRHNDRFQSKHMQMKSESDMDEHKTPTLCKSDTIRQYITSTNVQPTSTDFYPSGKFEGNIHRCEYCDKVFKSLFGQTKHESKCSGKKIKEYESKIEKIKEDNKRELEKIQNENDKLMEINKILADDRRRYAELSLTNSKATSKTMSLLSYLVYNQEESPPLKEISHEQIKAICNKNEDKGIPFAKTLLFHNKNKCLHKFIGDMIISVYKKDDKAIQALHSTDCSRLNYIIMDIVGDNKEWIHDNGGVKVSDRIINPILKDVRQTIYDHSMKLLDSEGYINKETRENIYSVFDQIDDAKLHKQISIYIAPYFKTLRQEYSEKIKNRRRKKNTKTINNTKKSVKKGVKKYTKKGNKTEQMPIEDTISEFEPTIDEFSD